MKDENVYFRPRARLMLELGEQLIKNETGKKESIEMYIKVCFH